jgi:hypothetical protein
MHKRARRALSVAIVAAAAATAYAALGTALVATPEVAVVTAAPQTAVQGTVSLANTGTSSASVASFARVPCDDPSMTITSPAPPFAIAAGSAQTITFDCPGTSTFGMRRCTYHALGAGSAELGTFMGVCATGSATVLSASPPTLTFPAVGSGVPVGTAQTQTVTITSSGSNTVGTLQLQTTDLDGTIQIGAPCNPNANGCDVANTAIGSFGVDIVCQPSAATTVTRELYVLDRFGEQLASPVSISCTGVAATGPTINVTTSPSPLDLGPVEVLGETGTGTVHVANVGPTGPLTIHTVAISGAGTDWTFTLGAPCNGALPCELAPGDSVEIGVKLTPSVLGTRNATMTIASNDPINGQLAVRLYGVGQGATLERAAGQAMAVDFGQVPKNGSATLQVELANRGNRDVTDVSLALSQSTQFSTTPASPASDVTVARGAAPTAIALTCDPGGATGTFTTMLAASAPDTLDNTPVVIAATCRGTDSVLAAAPTALQLGEIRAGTPPTVAPFALENVGSNALTLAQAPALNPPLSGFLVSGPGSLAIPGGGSATAQLVVSPQADGDFSTTITAADVSGSNPISIPVTGKFVTATVAAPMTVMLGTFCVNQPTTATPLSLAATGTGSVVVAVPRMASAPSQFQVAPKSPTTYPAVLPPGSTASVEVLPMRQGSASVITDDLVWSTDLDNNPRPHSTVTAQFLAAGAAIAPASLAFGAQSIHLYIKDAQPITIQNCTSSGPTLSLHPSIDVPFSIDSDFPSELVAAETATISVGFHPTKTGPFTGHLRITTSDQQVLDVTLAGEGSANGTPSDAGPGSATFHDTSFYACSCNAPSGAFAGGLPIALAVLLVTVRRRRRSGSS